MNVCDVIYSALQLLGRTDVSKAHKAGSMTEEQSQTLNALVHCYNAVEDELACTCFPLTFTENITMTDGKYYFSSLCYTPLKILSVTSGGKKVKYKLTPSYIATGAAQVEIKYIYCPDSKAIDDESSYDGLRVSQRLLSYGIAAEYCLIMGAAEESKSWESKYRLAIDGARKLSPDKLMPSRRWA